ncbi:MAG: hypothetical protein ABH882_04865 [Candidatus Omnitrophota bacterium]|nr:hypothetical protein [Candidatus Omnitrophota bacterium]MBU1928501.1 hypothetical protein [Candidatus Omnitrophota bacterium]MBU2035426.1 hypothetical protein [Candidatus Omnitrophota bacterium]MBU2258201.1 hypothetical protein [Candidatus Omnitrophota bacterium]
MLRKSNSINLFIIIMIIGLIGTAWAQQKQAKKDKVITTSTLKAVEGEISALTKNYIAIAYDKDIEKGTENEMSFPFDPKTMLLYHKRSLAELNAGDRVLVQYEEVKEESRQGNSIVNKAKSITFIKPAPKEPEPIDPVDNNAELAIKAMRSE